MTTPVTCTLIKLILAIFATCLLWALILGVFITLSILVPAAIIYTGYIACMSTDLNVTNAYMVRVFIIAVCGFMLMEVWSFVWSVLSSMFGTSKG